MDNLQKNNLANAIQSTYSKELESNPGTSLIIYTSIGNFRTTCQIENSDVANTILLKNATKDKFTIEFLYICLDHIIGFSFKHHQPKS